MNKYKIELHAHSSESSRCGSVKAAEVVKRYYEAGYKALVITDHYYARFFDKISNLSWDKQLKKYLSGYKAAQKAAQTLDFNVFLGIEIKFNNDPNEYLVYGLNEDFLKKHPNLHHLSLEEFRTLTVDQKQKILIFQAHPFRPGMAPAADQLLDGLEVYNGNQRHNSHNEQAFIYAKEHNLKMISASDFHEYEDLAKGGIIINSVLESQSDLVNILNSNNLELIRN